MQSCFGAKQAKRNALILTVIIGISITGISYAGASSQVVTTKYTILEFNSTEDITAFNDAIAFEAHNSLTSIFNSPTLIDIKTDLARKIDLLFEKVRLILDMRKPMKKVTIRVHSNDEQLKDSFQKTFKQQDSPRGWYLFENNTIYLNVQDVHEGMLAHELGHAIIDHYFAVKPPRATAEILAKYVDRHLFDEVKQY
jgi:hypothetical protein